MRTRWPFIEQRSLDQRVANGTAWICPFCQDVGAMSYYSPDDLPEIIEAHVRRSHEADVAALARRSRP